VLGVRSLFGHTVGGAAGAVSRITGAMGKHSFNSALHDSYTYLLIYSVAIVCKRIIPTEEQPLDLFPRLMVLLYPSEIYFHDSWYSCILKVKALRH
jgi:hypothetical protein